jgi:predicted outer membrane repeat protein
VLIAEGSGFHHESGGWLAVKGTVFSGCSTGDRGGAATIAKGGTNNTFIDCEFHQCSIGGNNEATGGALLLWIQGVTCTNCSWLNCYSPGRGAGVGQISDNNGENNQGKDVKLVGCVFASNRAEYDGGAMDIRQGNIICINCSFLDNTAGTYGGAVACVFYGNISFTDTVFVRNTKDRATTPGCKGEERGGAIMLWCEKGTPQGMSFRDCVFVENKIVQGCSMENSILLRFLLFYSSG